MLKTIATMVLALALLAQTTAAHAQGAASPDGCRSGETPSLDNGLGDIAVILGTDTVGDPLDCEHPNPQGAPGDTTQTTSGGVFYYYKFNNLVVFTDSAMNHWATTFGGIVTWSGFEPYPPEGRAILHAWDAITPGQAP